MLELNAVERRSGLTPETFAKEYLNCLKPVVFTDLSANWPALKIWTIDYFKEKYGDLKVPVVSNNFVRPGRGYLAADMEITFREYLEILESGPSDLRIFAWNIFSKAPELRDDFQMPTIMNGFVDELPFLFFGCEGSKVTLHFDGDMSHVFLNQILGRKRIILFDPSQSQHLYRLPFTVTSPVNILEPDFSKHPALKHVKGLEVTLEPGETLFIPRGYWHYTEYTDSGYSIILRAFDGLKYQLQGYAKRGRNYAVDRLMNRLLGKRWLKMKVALARRRAED